MPGYFRTIGTTFLAGRDFGSTQPQQSKPGVIVNEAFARSAGLGSEILGHRIMTPWTNSSYPIVGVVRTVRFAGPGYISRTSSKRRLAFIRACSWPFRVSPDDALALANGDQLVGGDTRDRLHRAVGPADS